VKAWSFHWRPALTGDGKSPFRAAPIEMRAGCNIQVDSSRAAWKYGIKNPIFKPSADHTCADYNNF